MLASNVTRETLEAAAAEVGVAVELGRENTAGTRWRVKVNLLVPDSARTPSGRRKRGEAGTVKWQRISAGYFTAGRRVHAVCWHGFRDFFRAVYMREPNAVFRTAFAVYRGSADFESKYVETGRRNIGSQMQPMAACEACECPEAGWAA